MAKGTSFAAKAKGKKKRTQSFVKYVKSVKSEKTGHWRFNEQMVAVNEGENLDDALKRLKKETMALDMKFPVMEKLVTEETPSEADALGLNTPDETPAEKAEKAESESAQPEVVKEETVETPQAENSSDKKADDENATEEKAKVDEDGSSEKSIEESVEEKTEA